VRIFNISKKLKSYNFLQLDTNLNTNSVIICNKLYTWNYAIDVKRG